MVICCWYKSFFLQFNEYSRPTNPLLIFFDFINCHNPGYTLMTWVDIEFISWIRRYKETPFVFLLVFNLFNLFLNVLKVVKMPVSTAVTVTRHVPRTVKRTHVIYRTERVSRVNQGGQGHIVTQVRWQCGILYFIKFHSYIVLITIDL